MSFPLFGEQLTFTQPDGTRFEVRGFGDQHNAIFETLDGFTVVRDSQSGFFHFAVPTPELDELRPSRLRVSVDDPRSINLPRGLRIAPSAAKLLNAKGTGLPKSRWRERLERQKSAERSQAMSRGILPAPPSRHTVGDFLGLCLLIDFADDPATIDREEVNAFCNQVGYSGFGNNGSVFDYFLENSAGRLRYRTLVAPYVRASRPKTFYADENIPYGERARDLIKEALTELLRQGFDFSGLTVDDQGGAFATNVFYAGRATNNWGAGLWPHASRLAAPFELGAGVASVDYQITAMSRELTLGIYCHENGHMLCDFPDLYQYSDQRRGIGSYCLMCGGGNADPRNPTGVGAYLKLRAGWAQAAALTPGTAATLAAGTNEVLVHAKGDGEYFVIENRQRLGRDMALPDSGLAVWHVDELGSNSEPDKAPIDHKHHECVLIQADGRADLENGINLGDSTDLFEATADAIFSDSSTPSSRWWSGEPSRLQIRDVEVANGNVSFSVELD